MTNAIFAVPLCTVILCPWLFDFRLWLGQPHLAAL
jgi:hypothetical protein